MRKCSQPIHASLTQLNITPLLDLGFVLLVIFILTTTPIVNDLRLKLPKASVHPVEAQHKANFITVDFSGTIYLNKKNLNLDQLRDELIALRTVDPDLSITIRGDGASKYRQVLGVMKALQQANIVKIELATEPTGK